MKKFSVGEHAFGYCCDDDIQIGVVPGEFGAKQIMLCALVCIIYKDKNIRFVRTINKEELKLCNIFVNDSFSNLFPQVPSYYSIPFIWEKKSNEILKNDYITYEQEFIKKIVLEKLMNIESFDILAYSNINSNSDSHKGFKQAIKMGYDIIKNIIYAAEEEAKSKATINANLQSTEGIVLELPLNTRWRNVLREHKDFDKIKFVLLHEQNGLYRIESVHQSIDLRKYLKNDPNTIAAERFYAKVPTRDAAYEVIRKILKLALIMKENEQITKYA